MIHFEIKGTPEGDWETTGSTGETSLKNYQEFIRMSYLEQMAKSDVLTENPVGVSMLFRMPIPKGYGKKTLSALREQKMACPQKPEINNLAKVILDSLKGLVYADSNQVVYLELSKVYSDNPGTTVCINEI